MYSTGNSATVRLVFISAVAVSLAIATSALASSGISPRFDGRYAGTMTRAPDMSAPTCVSNSPAQFEVKDGVIKSDADAPSQPAFDGFVTDEGFVSGHVRPAPGAAVSFSGRIDEQGMLTAGAIDERTGCAWIVKLSSR